MVPMQPSEVRRSMAIAATSPSEGPGGAQAPHGRAAPVTLAGVRDSLRGLGRDASSHAMAEPPSLPEEDRVRGSLACGLDHLTHKADPEAEVRHRRMTMSKHTSSS